MENSPINRSMGPLPRQSPDINSGNKKLDREKLKKACEEFESLFIFQMLKSMRQTIPQTGFLGNGSEKDIYQSLLDQELSKNMAKRNVMGLGELVYKQMIEREERNQPVSPEEKSLPPSGGKAGEMGEE